MDADSLISFCIPTYNNAVSLRECLLSLVSQAKPHGIPIYVSNNASTDSTLDVLSTFKKEYYSHLHFRSNDSNLGFDQNLINAIGMASSKYVWLFGDRLRLLPNAVNRVLNILKENDLDLLVLNTDAQAKLFQQERSVGNKRITSARVVFKELCLNVGTVGDQIVPMKVWKSTAFKKYVGRGWIHFAAIFESLASLKNVDAMFTARPSITYFSYRSTWIPNWFQLWDNWKAVIRTLPTVYSEDDKEFVIKYAARLQFFTVTNLLYLKAEQIYNNETYRRYREDLQKYSGISIGIAKAISELPISNIRSRPIAKRALLKGLHTLLSFWSSLNSFPRVRKRREEERKIMHRFLNEVERPNSLATSGEKVTRALKEKAVETLLICEDVEQSELECLSELAERTSTKVEIISSKTREGRKLKDSFGGVAAILRFPVSHYPQAKKDSRLWGAGENY